MKITYEIIKSLTLCYEPEKIGILPSYEASIPEFITEFRDKADLILVLCRNEFMSDRELRLFAVWCARQNIHLLDEVDINCINMAEKYALGLCTAEEMKSARARDRDRDRGSDSDWARDSARCSARPSARASAWESAWASASASACAWKSARAKQVDYLLNLFREKENVQTN